MVKENEIRINNYYNGGVELVGSLQAKLNANEHNDFQLTRGHFEALCGYTDWLKFINPIPLTEEWLEKFGAKQVKARSGIQKSFKLGSIRINMSNSGNFYCGKNVYNYVHMIQNLYYAIEQQELTQKIK